MAYKTPRVSGGVLLDDQTPGPSITLDTPAWFAWLETPTNVCFSYALFNRKMGYIDGFITVRKERRQRGGAYWTAYRRQGHHLRKVYCGPSAAVTQARLAQVASHLCPRDGPAARPPAQASPPAAPGAN